MSEEKKLRAGFIGSGFAAEFHYEALLRVRSAQVEVIGAYSRNRENLERFTAKRGLRAMKTVDEVIAESDVIHICTPPYTHEPITLDALAKNKSVIVEKPFTGYFGDGTDSFNGDTFSREEGLREALASVRRMLEAERQSNGQIIYAENWIYAPAVQKERELVEKTGAQILWMIGGAGHSGSHAPDYGKWRLAGGGSLMGKGCHPLSAIIYLKHVEGRKRNGSPIRPAAVSARTHAITRMPGFHDLGHVRTSYTDIEDFAMTHIIFEDGTIADVFASELVLGGVHNWLEVNANNHRTICNINPNTAMQTYNPVEENFADIYVVEKTGTKQGWSAISPDEAWFTGYQHEMEDFYRAVISNQRAESDSKLAADTIATIYAAYVSAEKKGREVAITSL